MSLRVGYTLVITKSCQAPSDLIQTVLLGGGRKGFTPDDKRPPTVIDPASGPAHEREAPTIRSIEDLDKRQIQAYIISAYEVH